MAPLKILFLAPRVPWPLDTGGKIRTFHLLRALARHHQVQLLTFRESAGCDAGGLREIQQLEVWYELFAQARPVRRIQDLVMGALGPMPVNLRKYQCEAMQQRVLQLVGQGDVDLIHCDHLHMAPYGALTRLPFVMDEHNVETLIWERFGQDSTQSLPRRLLFRQQAFWLRRMEASMADAASLVLLCSAADLEELNRLPVHGRPRTHVVPNGVDLEYFSEDGPAELSGHVFFTGSMDWAPNSEAVLNFLDEIWPVVRRELPELHFAVVGRNPSAQLRARGEAEGITVTGTVPDVRPFMRQALALVVPLRVGGGTRLKILEAFAAGVPVVSTALGIEGIQAVPDEHYLLAETATEFATQLQRIKDDAGLRQALVDAGGELVRQRYSWDAIGDGLAAKYVELFGRATS